MEESKRQRQVASMIEHEMNAIFQKEGLNVVHGGMISIAKVKVTPDLMEARFYISFFNIPEPEKMLKHIKDMDWKLRKLLAEKIKHQVRKIPVLSYYMDDTLDYVQKIDDLFRNLDIPKEE